MAAHSAQSLVDEKVAEWACGSVEMKEHEQAARMELCAAGDLADETAV
jgi:hypothetical protein